MATISLTFTTQQEIARAGSGASSAWSGDAISDDNNYCAHTDTVASGTRYTDWLVLSNCSPGKSVIGDTALISDILLLFRRRDTATGEVGVAVTVSLVHISKTLGSSPDGTGQTGGIEWPAAEDIDNSSFAGMWGHASITGAELKASTFSCWLSASVTDTVLDTSLPEVDRIAIQVTYANQSAGNRIFNLLKKVS